MHRKNRIVIYSESGYKVEDIELLELAAHFFLKELSKITAVDPLSCEIVITNEISSHDGTEPLNGDMEEIKVLDNHEGLRYYRCRLADYANSAETMRTLAHELVHVWQAANGSLIFGNSDEWIWRGQSFGNNPYNGTDEDLLLPWEVEADTLDLKLVKKFYKTYFS